MIGSKQKRATVTNAGILESALQLPDRRTATKAPDGKSTGLSLPSNSNANPLKPLGGSDRCEFNSFVLREVIASIWVVKEDGDPEAINRAIATAAAALEAFKPANEIEAMLAAQAVAMHFGAMECFRRAMIGEQSSEVASKLRRDGANLARGVADMLDAIDRKRGKAPQVVRVERVVVHDGGQAIVGNVQPVAVLSGGGGA